MLVSSHKVTNLIFDVSLLVDQRIPCESIVEFFRDAFVEKTIFVIRSQSPGPHQFVKAE